MKAERLRWLWVRARADVAHHLGRIAKVRRQLLDAELDRATLEAEARAPPPSAPPRDGDPGEWRAWSAWRDRNRDEARRARSRLGAHADLLGDLERELKAERREQARRRDRAEGWERRWRSTARAEARARDAKREGDETERARRDPLDEGRVLD